VRTLVLASSNPGKLREIVQILAPLGIEAVPQSAYGVPKVDEPHDTFLENALAKARHASRATGLAALADDSGICVPTLDGAPGVQSARFAGEPKSDARNNEKLVALMRDKADRRAYYYCVMVLTRSPGDPTPVVADARWHGEVVLDPRGANGFGYDPHFLLPELGKTAAELESGHKNRISHRGRALAHLVAQLRAQRDEG